MPKVILAKNQEKKDLKDAVAQTLTDLDTIINGVEGSSLAQTQAAVKTIARHQKKMIKRLVQII